MGAKAGVSLNPHTHESVLDYVLEDLDLVLVDATVPLDSMRMLPAGHLREPLESLGRAHAVVINFVCLQAKCAPRSPFLLLCLFFLVALPVH